MSFFLNVCRLYICYCCCLICCFRFQHNITVSTAIVSTCLAPFNSIVLISVSVYTLASFSIFFLFFEQKIIFFCLDSLALVFTLFFTNISISVCIDIDLLDFSPHFLAFFKIQQQKLLQHALSASTNHKNII